jgi:predicted nucleic acid-binding protein
MTLPTKNDVFVDTSGWACYLDNRDLRYPAVAAFIQQALGRQRRLITINYVITELVALLSSRNHLPRKRIVATINAIKTDVRAEIIHIDQEFDSRAWSLLEARLDKEWSLVDASSFEVMRHFGITQALTTDHHFEQAGFVLVPEEARRQR